MTGRDPLDQLDDDIREHLARETQELIDRGMTPEDAQAAARRKFGSVTMAKEDARAVWIPVWFDQWLQDIRYGLRSLRRAPGFAAIVIATLAVGMGLNTAVFCVVNAVLVRPLSYPNADRLVWLSTRGKNAKDDTMEIVVEPELAAWRDHATTLDGLAGFFVASEPIDLGDEVLQARVAAVTDGFWTLTGARFAWGGPPARNEQGVVLSHELFTSRFHGDPSIVGRSVLRYGVQTQVTGVLQPDFHPQFPPPPAFAAIGPGTIDFYRAIPLVPSSGPGVLILNVVGLAKPGVSIEQIRQDIESIRAAEKRSGTLRGPPSLAVRPYADKLVGAAHRPLLILQIAVALVLLIACANVANLLLARAASRQHEIAVRAALGAGRGRLLRQFLVESLLLASAGGMAGLVVARTGVDTVVGLIPRALPRLAETSIDARVFAFAAGAAIATALVCGFTPALLLWKRSLQNVLGGYDRTSSGAPGSLRIRHALVAVELAVAVVLLVGASLMVRSFDRLTAYPRGFEPEKILTMHVQFSGPRYRPLTARWELVDELLMRARQAPGVEAASVCSNGDSRMLLRIAGAPDLPPDRLPAAVLSSASGGYAGVVGLRVISGRWLNDHEPEPVFVINETLARRYFNGVDPLGRRIRLPFLNETRTGAIVGIVADLRATNLAAAPEPELFINYEAAPLFAMTLLIRTAGDPASAAPALRALLSGADRTQPLFDVKPLDTVLAESIAQRRFNTLLLAVFGVSALLFAAVGVYGVIAYSVTQRSREIGIRMALGAERTTVVRLVVGQGMILTLYGVMAGAGCALMFTRAMAGLLYDIPPTDPVSFAAVTVVLLVAALAACGVPALRAARVDPLVALRCE
jgi:predicted permease